MSEALLSIARWTPPPEPDPGLLRLWRTWIDVSANPGDGDIEEWTEDACRLRESLRTFDEVWLVERHDRTSAVGLRSHRRVRVDELVAELSPTPIGLQAGYSCGMAEPADTYAASTDFAAYANRPLRVVEGGIEALDAAIRATAAEHGPDVWVKVARGKYGISRTDASDLDRMAEDLDGIRWAAIGYEGDPGVFVVAPHVDMVFEYRMFVVGGVPVVGAGAVEAHTPLDSRGDRFDDRVVAYRSGASPVVSRPDLVERYVERAEAVCGHLLGQGLDTYVLDLALDAGRDEVVVVELNGLSNAGLYAADVAALVDALAAQPARQLRSRPDPVVVGEAVPLLRRRDTPAPV